MRKFDSVGNQFRRIVEFDRGEADDDEENHQQNSETQGLHEIADQCRRDRACDKECGESVEQIGCFPRILHLFLNAVMQVVVVTGHNADTGFFFDVFPVEAAQNGKENVKNGNAHCEQRNEQSRNSHCLC